MSLSRHVDAFTTFAASHLKNETIHDYHIQLKTDHSLRVLENGRVIIDGEGITGHTADLCLLASLYHDIGRFPQFSTYGTYKDADSTNHGRLGVLTLRDHALPDTVSQADWRTIRAAVGLHNVKTLNPRLPEKLATVTKVVRDADKIDIYPVIIDHLDGSPEERKVVIHHLEEAPDKYTDAVFDTVMAGEIGSYDSLHYANDFLLLTTGWIFTLNYATSIRMFAKSGLVERAFSILPKDEKIQTLKDKILKFMHYNRSTPS